MLRTAVLRNVTTPIIMFTSGAGTDVDLATVRAGAADYLLKTELSPSLLSRTIRYAIERSRLLNEMRSLARHDHLTGLLTRREMDRVLEEELVRSHRYGHPVALILLDLDHFKQVNDTYGHVSGDAALRWVAAVVSQCARDTDRAARYGGDELAVLLPETDHVGACVLAERIRAKVAAADRTPARCVGHRDHSCDAERRRRLAAGVHGVHPLRVHRRADAALYQAKRSRAGTRSSAPARPVAARPHDRCSASAIVSITVKGFSISAPPWSGGRRSASSSSPHCPAAVGGSDLIITDLQMSR